MRNKKVSMLSVLFILIFCFSGMALAQQKGHPKHKKKPAKRPSVQQVAANHHRRPPANHASKGYPNGRPWQAVERDFDKVHRKLDYIGKTTKAILLKVEDTDEDLSHIHEQLHYIEEGVAALKSTLDVQVTVVPATLDQHTDDGVVARLYVQVNMLGMGVYDLGYDAFAVATSFVPTGGSASYCGSGCFTNAGSGLYELTLEGDHVEGNYIGNVVVENGNDEYSHTGTALMNFEIEESGAVVQPL